MRARGILVQAAVLVVGLLVGFFFVFNFLFSDGPTSPLHAERLVSYLLLLAGTFVPAVLGSRFGGGGSPWRWALLAGLPGLAVALLFLGAAVLGGNLDLATLPALYALCSAAGAFAGAWLGIGWLTMASAD